MSEEMLVKYCSPTLAGMKTGSIFMYRSESIREMRNAVRHWNRILFGKGLRVLPLRYNKNAALIYIYRPTKLRKDLADETACHLLHDRGYITGTPERCITRLIQRLTDYEEFPHEIGLFLGYPPEDVCGFIENKARNCKCCGCWKVYGDAEVAQKTFAMYKKCTELYCAQYASGQSIERLAVAG